MIKPQTLNELIVDAYGETPPSTVTRRGQGLFDVTLPDMVVRVDFPGRGRDIPNSSEALCYALCFFDEQLSDTKIALWERFRDRLDFAKLLAARGWIVVEQMARMRAR